MRAPRGQDGFALIEVVVAAVVLVILLTGVGIQLTSEFGTIGSVRNEQAGEAVLTKALAEVRAMPFADVSNGLSSSDSTATATSTYIKITGSTWTFKDPTDPTALGVGEAINHYTPTGTSSNPPAPFYPHVSTVKENSITFTVRAFPTKYKTGATTLTDVYRVTVIVKWSAPSHGTPLTLVGQTLVYSTTSTCATMSRTKVPFSAPCTPDFTSTGFADAGSIELQPATSDVTPIKGMSFKTFSLVLPGVSETSALTQISTVTGTAQASGATVTPGSTRDELLSVATTATNDLAQGSGTSQSTSGTSTLSSLSAPSSNANTLTATPSVGDTVASVSTIAAKTATACKNLSTTTQTTTLPCARGTATQVAEATLKADLLTEDLGTMPLASVAATTTHANKVFSARDGTTCTTTSGCITSTVTRGLGTVRLAGIPTRFITDTAGPPGFSRTNYSLQLTNYSASASASARSSTAGRKTPKATIAGTLSYYTLTTSSYKSVSLTGSGASVTIPTVTATDAAAGATLTISTSISLGSIATSASGTSTCVSACSYRATSPSPIAATITYKLTQGPIIADFVMTVNLGQTVATASYQKAT